MAVTVGVLVSLAATAQQTSPVFEAEVIERVNALRREHGLPGLVPDARLREAALGHAFDMAVWPCFQHDDCQGGAWFDRIYRRYPRPHPIAENIAAGKPDPASVVAAWMNSPAHRANILHPAWRGIGVGYVHLPGSPHGHYWTQNFGSLPPIPGSGAVEAR